MCLIDVWRAGQIVGAAHDWEQARRLLNQLGGDGLSLHFEGPGRVWPRARKERMGVA